MKRPLHSTWRSITRDVSRQNERAGVNMNLHYVPLLQIQRDLQGLPRNYERFQQYLRTISPDGATLELPPLGIMNPMGKDHVTALLDALLALDADGIAARALAE